MNNNEIIKQYKDKFEKRIDEHCNWTGDHIIKTILEDINNFWLSALNKKDEDWKEKMNKLEEIPQFKGTLESLNKLRI
jgi:hypothetical protein